MNLISFFKNIFSGKVAKQEEKDLIQDHCPMCWGFNEYDHKVRKAVEDKYIDVKNHKTDYIKSQGFVKTHIDGRKKKKLKVEVCPKCGLDQNGE